MYNLLIIETSFNNYSFLTSKLKVISFLVIVTMAVVSPHCLVTPQVAGKGRVGLRYVLLTVSSGPIFITLALIAMQLLLPLFLI